MNNDGSGPSCLSKIAHIQRYLPHIPWFDRGQGTPRNRRRSILTSSLWMICAIVVGADHLTRAMAKRECSQCGGELVLAVRANQPQTNNDGPILLTSSFTSWRCCTCGSAFTAAQLREDKRRRAKAPDPAWGLAGHFSRILRS